MKVQLDSRQTALKCRMLSMGMVSLNLTGRCMEPLFKSADIVTVVPSKNLIESNLYLFRLPNGNLAVHRLIINDLEDGYLTFKGDRSKRAEVVPSESVIGEVSYIRFSTGHGGIYLNRWYFGKIFFLHISRMTWRKNSETSKFRKYYQKIIMCMYVVVALLVRTFYQIAGRFVRYGGKMEGNDE